MIILWTCTPGSRTTTPSLPEEVNLIQSVSEVTESLFKVAVTRGTSYCYSGSSGLGVVGVGDGAFVSARVVGARIRDNQGAV